MSALPSAVLRNITIDDNDTSLKYSQGWKGGVSNGAVGGGFHTASGTGDGLHVELPANTVAVYYFGYKQPQGAICGVCIDCAADGTGDLKIVDAHDASAGGSDSPALLYSKTDLNPDLPHSLALINFPDTRFANQSQISLDAFIVTVKDQENHISSTTVSTDSPTTSPSAVPTISLDDPAVPSVPATSVASTNAVTSQTSVSSSSAAREPSATSTGLPAGSPNNFASSASKLGQLRSTAVRVGVILGVLILTGILVFGTIALLRRRRRRAKRPFIQIQPAGSGFPESGENGTMPPNPFPPYPFAPQMASRAPEPPLTRSASVTADNPVPADQPRTVPRSVFTTPTRNRSIIAANPFTMAELEAQRQQIESAMSNRTVESYSSDRSAWTPPPNVLVERHPGSPQSATPLPTPPVHRTQQGNSWELV